MHLLNSYLWIYFISPLPYRIVPSFILPLCPGPLLAHVHHFSEVSLPHISRKLVAPPRTFEVACLQLGTNWLNGSCYLEEAFVSLLWGKAAQLFLLVGYLKQPAAAQQLGVSQEWRGNKRGRGNRENKGWAEPLSVLMTSESQSTSGTCSILFSSFFLHLEDYGTVGVLEAIWLTWLSPTCPGPNTGPFPVLTSGSMAGPANLCRDWLIFLSKPSMIISWIL